MKLKKVYSIIAMALIVFQCLLITPENIFAIDNLDSVENESLSIDVKLKPILSKNIISINEVADVTFECNMDVSYSEINADGVDVDIVDTDLLQFQLGVTDENGFGRFDLIALTADGEEIQSTVYTYQHQNNMYLSEIAHEVAWYLSKESSLLLESGEVDLVAKASCEEEYTTLFGSTLNYEVSKSDTHNESATKTMIEGHIDWETYQSEGVNNPTLPMRNARVELRKKEVIGSTLINSDMTDEKGDFTIYVNNEDLEDTQDVFIRICLEANTFTVGMDWLITHYYYDSGVQFNLSPGSYMNFDCTIPINETLTYKATYVHQAMVIAERFAYAMGLRTSNRIRVAYPGYGKIEWEDENGITHTFSLEDMAFCYGNFLNNAIAVIGVNSYNNTEMIVHEYSHYIQCSLGNFGEEIPEVIFMSNHNSSDDDYKEKEDKSFAMHLAWSEGWGYAFSVMAQKYYQSEYAGMNKYDITQELINTYNHNNFYGEFQEKTVTGFLWELLDQNKIVYNPNAPAEELDYQLPWTPQEWWNMTTVSGTCRFLDFMRLIEEEGYDESMNIDYKSVREGIAEYLTKYNIAPQINSITYTSGTPTINVKVNGSISYPNNRLVIKVFDENNFLAKSDIIEVNRGRFDNFNLTIPTTVWIEVLSKCSCTDGQTTNLKISVEGYRKDTTDPDGSEIEEEFQVTGPYYSEYKSFSFTHEHTYSSVNAATHNRYCSGCEMTTVQPHRFVYAKFNEALHSARCADCGYFQLMSHNMVYERVDGRYHEHHCSYCSYSEGNSVHVLKSNGSTDRYQNCTACGALVDTGINIFPIFKSKIAEEEYTE